MRQNEYILKTNLTKLNGLEVVIFVKLNSYACEKLHILSIMVNQVYNKFFSFGCESSCVILILLFT